MKACENSIIEILEAFGSEPLLQAGELRASEMIPSPTSIPDTRLAGLHEFALEYCNRNHLIAVAFTEFTQNVRDALGFDDI
jgi:hypothetical protein